MSDNAYIINQNPTNINLLTDNDFRLKIHRAPHVNYFIQACTIPGITLPVLTLPTPHINFPIESNKLIFDNLSVSFKVDEQLINYLEIYNWLYALGKPTSFLDYRNRFGTSQPKTSAVDQKHLPEYSDVSLFILTNSKNPNVEILYRDAFPIGISQINFDTTREDNSYASCTCFFAYSHFEIKYVDETDTKQY